MQKKNTNFLIYTYLFPQRDVFERLQKVFHHLTGSRVYGLKRGENSVG